VTNSDQDHITLPNYLEVLFITLQWMQLIELIIQFASDSIGAQANSVRIRTQYFQMISYFHKCDYLMVNVSHHVSMLLQELLEVVYI